MPISKWRCSLCSFPMWVATRQIDNAKLGRPVYVKCEGNFHHKHGLRIDDRTGRVVAEVDKREKEAWKGTPTSDSWGRSEISILSKTQRDVIESLRKSRRLELRAAMDER